MDEPHRRVFYFKATVLAVVIFVTFLGVTSVLDFEEGSHATAPFILLILVASIIMHEGIHLLATPYCGRSRRTTVGVWLLPLMFYVYHDGPRKRGKLALCLILPFLTLSIVPLAFFAISGVRWELASPWVALNGAVAAGDILGFFTILRKVPAGASVRNKGWYSFWKADPETMARYPAPAPRPDARRLRPWIGLALWVGGLVFFFVSVIFVFDPFFSGLEYARNDLWAHRAEFPPGHGFHPSGAVCEGDIVRLWSGAPESGHPEVSRGIWRTGYRFLMRKRGKTVVCVDERPEVIRGPDRPR